MMTITGGEYQGVEYGTMYDNNTIYNSADRYDDKNGLIGVVGYEQHKVDGEWVNGKYAMLSKSVVIYRCTGIQYYITKC